jgi:colanic acid/amylovoran biosynthesis glycosyltransferase
MVAHLAAWSRLYFYPSNAEPGDPAMRVAFILDRFPLLSETFIVNQLAGLIDRGVVPDIYALNRGDTQQMHVDVQRYHLLDKVTYAPDLPAGKIGRLLSGAGLFARLLPRNPRAAMGCVNPCKHGHLATSMRLIHTAAPFFTAKRYDVVHCNFGHIGQAMATLRSMGLMPGKLVVQYYGFDASQRPKMEPAGYYDQLFAQASAVMALSNYMTKQLADLGCPQDKLVIHRTGADGTKFIYKPRTLTPGEPIRIISIARLQEKKGLEYAIDAIARIAAQRQDFIYQIIGDGPLRQPLEAQIQKLGLSDRIELLGWKVQEQVRELLDQSHLLLTPSVTARAGDQEGTPTVIVEGAMMGLPVLSTLHSGIPDMVLDGTSGYLVPERDVDALAASLCKLMDQPQDWPQMGKAGSDHIRKLFDVNGLNDQLVDIYRQVIATTD